MVLYPYLGEEKEGEKGGERVREVALNIFMVVHLNIIISFNKIKYDIQIIIKTI